METNLPSTETADQTARRMADETVMLAVANFRVLYNLMVERGMDPNVKFGELEKVTELSYKVASPYLDPKKYLQNASTGPTFKFNINLPGNTPGSAQAPREIVIEAETLPVDENAPEALEIGPAPAYLSALPVPILSNLDPDLPDGEE